MLPQAFAISLDRIQITMKDLPKDKEKIKNGKKIYNSNKSGDNYNNDDILYLKSINKILLTKKIFFLITIISYISVTRNYKTAVEKVLFNSIMGEGKN